MVGDCKVFVWYVNASFTPVLSMTWISGFGSFSEPHVRRRGTSRSQFVVWRPVLELVAHFLNGRGFSHVFYQISKGHTATVPPDLCGGQLGYADQRQSKAMCEMLAFRCIIYQVMDVLQQIAKLGLVVVTTIHQPRHEIYSKLDDILLLTRTFAH